uniref:HAT C-terminal dimerisation domain-containing protein n=1 Tax=Arundo donax TaxID=35708 RepID=A0A0A9FHY9_ARUDO
MWLFFTVQHVLRNNMIVRLVTKNGLLLEVVERLKMFNDITAVFSRTNYVTANAQLLKICEAKMKIKEWSACGNPIIEEMSSKMIEKFDKYWKDIKGPMGIAIILDPRFKIDYLLGFFEILWGESDEGCLEKVHEIKNFLCDLMKEYQVDEDEDNIESSAPPLDNSSLLYTISARVATRRPTITRVKSELDRYLEDELILITTENFQILDWWKVARSHYPTLRKIAHDIFTIPVSTAASESTFSTSGGFLVSIVAGSLRRS